MAGPSSHRTERNEMGQGIPVKPQCRYPWVPPGAKTTGGDPSPMSCLAVSEETFPACLPCWEAGRRGLGWVVIPGLLGGTVSSSQAAGMRACRPARTQDWQSLHLPWPGLTCLSFSTAPALQPSEAVSIPTAWGASQATCAHVGHLPLTLPFSPLQGCNDPGAPVLR